MSLDAIDNTIAPPNVGDVVTQVAKVQPLWALLRVEDRARYMRRMAQAIIDRMAPGTPIAYAGGDRGWVGDVPRFAYSTERLARLGWRPRLTSDEAVLRAAAELTVPA